MYIQQSRTDDASEVRCNISENGDAVHLWLGQHWGLFLSLTREEAQAVHRAVGEALDAMPEPAILGLHDFEGQP